MAAAILAAATAHADVPTGRLPQGAMPLSYRIDLREDPAAARFTGHVEIDVQLARATRSLYLNGSGLNVTHIAVRSGGRVIATHYAQVAPVGVARLDMATAVPAGRATLVFDYDAALRDGARGLYHLKAGGRWYSYTQFEEVEARSVFPSFDEPGFKTPYTISMTVPHGLTAVSNAALQSSAPAAGGWTTYRFAPTLPLPTYLVAMMAGPFATAAGAVPPTLQRVTPLPLRIVATAPQAAKLDYALAESGRIVTLLEEYFGTAFPFPKLDQIATPAWQSETAMENAGADTYADMVLLLDRGATTAQKRAFGMVVGHELSHQWFGDLVTPAWWSDVWLNESFAEWMGFRIGSLWRPDLKIADGAVAGALQAMDVDGLLAGRPIRQPVRSAEDAESVFDEVTYDKGAQVVTQTAAYLGDATFRDGVRLHLRRHRFGSADSDQFFAALSDAAHDARITASMKSFVDQPGVPLLTFAHDGDGWTATQSRYALLGETPPPQSWVIPLCVRALSGSPRCMLADRPVVRLNGIGAGPLVPNADGHGYYRFELPQADWTLLIDRLATLPASEALVADDSLWASFAAGRARPAQLIDAARRLADNASSAAVLDGAERLRAWHRHDLVPAAALPAYRRLMAALYGPVLARLGLDLRSGAYAQEDPDRRALREALVSLLSQEAADPDLRGRLAVAAGRYLGGDVAALDQGFLTSALTVHLQQHDLATARRLLLRAEASDDVAFRPAGLDAVGAGAPVGTAEEAAALIFAPGVGARTRGRIAGALLERPDARPFAEAAILPRVADLGHSIPSLSAFGDTRSFDQACSEEEARAIEAAVRPHVADLHGGALSLDRMVERIRTCSVLKARRGGEIAQALAVR